MLHVARLLAEGLLEDLLFVAELLLQLVVALLLVGVMLYVPGICYRGIADVIKFGDIAII